MSTCKNKGCPQCYGVVGCPAVPVKLCSHPSAKVTDEAEPLRTRIAELEGRLALRKVPRTGPGPVDLIYSLTLVIFFGLGTGWGLLLNAG